MRAPNGRRTVVDVDVLAVVRATARYYHEGDERSCRPARNTQRGPIRRGRPAASVELIAYVRVSFHAA